MGKRSALIFEKFNWPIRISTWISRAMLVTDTRLKAEDTKQYLAEPLSYCVFPPGSEAGNTDEPIYGIQQNDESMACLKGQCKWQQRWHKALFNMD